MQDHKRNLYANQDHRMLRYVLKKLNYEDKQLENLEEASYKNKLLQKELHELRNLKYKVLTFGSNELHQEHANYLDNFYMEFSELDIMSNYKLLCMPK